MLVAVAVLSFLWAPSSIQAFAPHPVSLSRPSLRLDSSSTVIETPAEKVQETITTSNDAEQADRHARTPPFWVRLWNDPFNKREFVARCLAEVCGKSDGESFTIMMQAHQQGMGLIGQYDLEIAELYTTSLKSQGLMVDMVPVGDEE